MADRQPDEQQGRWWLRISAILLAVGIIVGAWFAAVRHDGPRGPRGKPGPTVTASPHRSKHPTRVGPSTPNSKQTVPPVGVTPHPTVTVRVTKTDHPKPAPTVTRTMRPPVKAKPTPSPLQSVACTLNLPTCRKH